MRRATDLAGAKLRVLFGHTEQPFLIPTSHNRTSVGDTISMECIRNMD